MPIASTMDALEALAVPAIRKAFIDAIQGIIDNVTISDLISAINNNDSVAAFDILGFNQATLYPILEQITDTYKQAGYIVGDSFPTSRLVTPSGNSFTFTFDMRNPAVEAYLAQDSSQLVTLLTNEALQNVRTVLQRGAIAGDNPRTTALNLVGRIDPVTKERIGGIIGLTKNQEIWSANMRTDLINLDSNYFSRELRDKRFDSVVRKAIDSETPLSDDIISKIITSYNNSLLKFRADNVARTETIQAMNAADFAAHAQLVATGAVTASAVEKLWDGVGDKRERWSHRQMDIKYGQPGSGVGLNEPFILPSGHRLMYPGDTSMGADGAETINCRCRVKAKVNWFAGLAK